MKELYLNEIGNSEENIKTKLRWGEYLLSEFGQKEAFKILSFYERAGWISSDVREELEEVLSDSDIVPPETSHEPELTAPFNKLEGTHYEDHAYSLQYVADLSNDTHMDVLE